MNTIRDMLLQIPVLWLISSFRQQWTESDVTVHMKAAEFYLNYASLQAQEAFYKIQNNDASGLCLLSWC